MYKNYSIILYLFIFLFLGCNKNPTSSDQSSFTLKWENRITATYSYSSGILSGMNISAGFEVTQGSGELVLKVKITQGDGNSKTVKHDVETGMSYRIRIPVSMSGTRSCTPGAVIAKIEISGGSGNPLVYYVTCDFDRRGARTYTIGTVSVSKKNT